MTLEITADDPKERIIEPSLRHSFGYGDRIPEDEGHALLTADDPKKFGSPILKEFVRLIKWKKSLQTTLTAWTTRSE
jgi:hypothetical protein